MLDDAMASLQVYLFERLTALLDEMQWFLFDCFSIEISVTNIYRGLKRAGWSRKKTARRALQQSSAARAVWRLKRRQWRPEEIVAIDELGAHERTGDRKYGWAPIGQRPVAISDFYRSVRWSILPALSIEGYVGDPLIYHGSINGEVFAT